MFDLKIITFLLVFGVLFGGIVSMVGSEISTTGEYVAPEAGANYTEPGLGMFDTLSLGLSLNTGIWIIDNWFVTIALALVGFLIIRVLRGQG